MREEPAGRGFRGAEVERPRRAAGSGAAPAKLLATNALDLLEHIPCAVVVVDPERRLLVANAAARAMLEQASDLMIEDGCVRATSGAGEESLRNCVDAAGRPHAGTDDGADGAASGLPCAHLGRMIVAAVPLSSSATDDGGDRRDVALFLCNPSAPVFSASPAALQLFGLTPAELRVAVLVGGGQGLASVAKSLGVGVNSVRTHVCRIFEKTGTKRQADLVRFLGCLASGLPRPAPDFRSPSRRRAT